MFRSIEAWKFRDSSRVYSFASFLSTCAGALRLKRRLIAFSLIELILALLAISVITVAFAPVISKKIKLTTITAGNGVGNSGGGGGGGLDYSFDCDNYGSDCKMCHSDECFICLKDCESGYGLDTPTCSCQQCSEIEEHCLQCRESECRRCAAGYYLDNGTCTSCPAGTFSSEGATSCSNCPDGKYSTYGASSCSTPTTVANCTEYSKTEDACAKCETGYYSLGSSCVQRWKCEGDNFMQVGDLCVTRRNPGDSDVLAIPTGAGVTKVANGETCSGDLCCWDSGTASCGTGNGSYSGCNRTVCKWYAANAICANFNAGGKTWRLPTQDEMSDWGTTTYSLGVGNNGLMLCNYYSGYSSARCYYAKGKCIGAFDNNCFPHSIWSGNKYDASQAYNYYLTNDNWAVTHHNLPRAFSTRCVTENIPCTASHCEVCVDGSGTQCSICEDGYVSVNGVCRAIDFVTYEGITWTKYNAGDTGGPVIPDTVTTCTAGQNCSGGNTTPTCWQGTTAGACDSKVGNYSGCNRTVCNWYAANLICAANGLSLPKFKEFETLRETLGTTSAYKTDTGTLFCCGNSPRTQTKCESNNGNCKGAIVNYCHPNFVWGVGHNDTYAYYYQLGWADNLVDGQSQKKMAYSVRCIRHNGCDVDHCATCVSNDINTCATCEYGYDKINGKCIATVTYKGITWSKYNAGDDGGPVIPTGIGIEMCLTTSATGNCGGSNPTCWYGQTGANGCNNTTGYDGCTRTVCNWYAANLICAANGMRLPYNDEFETLVNRDTGCSNFYYRPESGLNLCTRGNSSSEISNCSSSADYVTCYGAYYNNSCYPHNVWGLSLSHSDTNAFHAELEGWVFSYQNFGWPQSDSASVRCVLPMTCMVANCEKCAFGNPNKCETCNSGYASIGGQCQTKPALPPFDTVTYNGTIWTKYNAGDTGGPPIPDTVTMCTTGASCSGGYYIPTCWQGDTASQDTCDNKSGYDGCHRTVCNWYAANLICAYINMRTPNISNYSAIMSRSNYFDYTSGIDLCSNNKSYSYTSSCPGNQVCNGADSNLCMPWYFWGEWLENYQGGRSYGLYNGALQYGGNGGRYQAYSVRCVSP